jgi:predicted O-methyltransferase YrrM
MRSEFLEAVAQLEYEDALFQDALSSQVMMATSLETWAVARPVAEKLYDLVLKYKPATILEVGTSLGYSTIWIAEAARQYGGKIITLEHETSKILKTQKLFDELELQNTVILIETDARKFLESFDKQIDFLFLDAMKREYIDYIKLAERNMPSGALLLADDVVTWRRKLDNFFEYIESSGKYTNEIFEIGHGLLLAEKLS